MRLGVFGWIGVIVGVLGGLIGMGAAIVAAPIPGIIFSVVFIVIFGGMFLFFMLPFFNNSQIVKNGKDASATVLQIWDTGVTINMNPEIGLLLQVTPTDGTPAFQAKATKLISRLETSMYQPGVTLQVKYDPNNTNKVAIVGYGAASSMNEQDAMKMALEIDKKNKELIAKGKSAKGIILTYTELGVNINGDNPLVKMDVQVMPEGKEPFKSVTKAPILNSSIYKYQPGKEINVKYDPDDTSTVVIDSGRII